jgi:ABC-type nitrate/sulfonate/bicarbonate transport system ATPase subunit
MISLNIDHLDKSYPAKHDRKIVVFADFSMHVEVTVNRPVLAICGPSGCGKTTLLRMLAGTQACDRGSLSLESDAEPIRANQTATVPQRNSCFPWLTALENVAYGLQLRGVPTEERYRRARGLLERVGLLDVADHYPATLSGGMLQRVALARALAIRPKLLLLDEPFGALDPETKREIEFLTLEIIEEEAAATVLVTHDLSEALVLSDRILIFPTKPVHRCFEDFQVTLERPRSRDTIFSEPFRDALKFLDERISLAIKTQNSEVS